MSVGNEPITIGIDLGGGHSYAAFSGQRPTALSSAQDDGSVPCLIVVEEDGSGRSSMSGGPTSGTVWVGNAARKRLEDPQNATGEGAGNSQVLYLRSLLEEAQSKRGGGRDDKLERLKRCLRALFRKHLASSHLEVEEGLGSANLASTSDSGNLSLLSERTCRLVVGLSGLNNVEDPIREKIRRAAFEAGFDRVCLANNLEANVLAAEKNARTQNGDHAHTLLLEVNAQSVEAGLFKDDNEHPFDRDRRERKAHEEKIFSGDEEFSPTQSEAHNRCEREYQGLQKTIAFLKATQNSGAEQTGTVSFQGDGQIIERDFSLDKNKIGESSTDLLEEGSDVNLTLLSRNLWRRCRGVWEFLRDKNEELDERYIRSILFCGDLAPLAKEAAETIGLSDSAIDSSDREFRLAEWSKPKKAGSTLARGCALLANRLDWESDAASAQAESELETARREVAQRPLRFLDSDGNSRRLTQFEDLLSPSEPEENSSDSPDKSHSSKKEEDLQSLPFEPKEEREPRKRPEDPSSTPDKSRRDQKRRSDQTDPKKKNLDERSTGQKRSSSRKRSAQRQTGRGENQLKRERERLERQRESRWSDPKPDKDSKEAFQVTDDSPNWRERARRQDVLVASVVAVLALGAGLYLAGVFNTGTNGQPSTSVNGNEYRVTTTPPQLNVRRRPTMASDVVRQVSEGTSLAVLQKEDGWEKVRLENSETGWVASRYTQRLSPGEASSDETSDALAENRGEAGGSDKPNASDRREQGRRQSTTDSDAIAGNSGQSAGENQSAGEGRSRSSEENVTGKDGPSGGDDSSQGEIPGRTPSKISPKAQIASIAAPSKVSVGEEASVKATVQVRGIARSEGTYRWLLGGRTIDTGRLSIGENSGENTIRLQHEFQSAGTKSLLLVIEGPNGSVLDRQGREISAALEFPRTTTLSTTRRIDLSDGDIRLSVPQVTVEKQNQQGSIVRVLVRLKSIGYDRTWVGWGEILKESYLEDAANHLNEPNLSESDTPGRGKAAPGEVREGEIVFYLSEEPSEIKRPVLHFAYYPFEDTRKVSAPLEVR